MLNDLRIQGSHQGYYATPTISFSANKGYCVISGESYLEETSDFYNTLIDWIRSYSKDAAKPIFFEFNLRYFDSSSSKAILNILNTLKKAKENGTYVKIYWHIESEYGEYSELLEEIEDYQKDTGLDIIVYFDHAD